MSDRNRSRKSGQMAGKSKQGMKNQGQRAQRDSDRMINDQQQDTDQLTGGMERETRQARPDMKDDKNSGKKKLQHH
ncbi:hypothetical protein K7711_33065 [Nocardia sp. CA2R105]|uniref:hypothetical protein n=1 Tax=Nocardia coffeae TaxID=2873381 RepID=UPI001CA79D7C|nr:hypothetical protein [Nocardia coffeae]MBY8861347.1 hypothetical protein [Nocardia coffeae]